MWSTNTQEIVTIAADMDNQINIVYAEAVIRTESNIKVERMTKGKKNQIMFFFKVIKDKKNIII